MKIAASFDNHPDTERPESPYIPLVVKIDVRGDSVTVRVETKDGEGLCEHYVERRSNVVSLHVWDESGVDTDPTHDPIILVGNVRQAIKSARDREVGNRSHPVIRTFDHVVIESRPYTVSDPATGLLYPVDKLGCTNGPAENYDLSSASCAHRGMPQVWYAPGARRIEMCDDCSDWIIVADDHEPGAGTTCNNCTGHGPGKDGSS